MESSRKTEFGLESGDDEGGRYRRYRQIFWNEEVGGLWKMIRMKRNLDVR